MIKKLIAVVVLGFTAISSYGLDDASAPTKIQIPFASSAGGAYVRTVPVASQIGIQNGAASYTDGFPPLNFTPINAGGVPPFGQDMNGIIRDISAHARWWAAGGPVYYDSTHQTAIGGYPLGAVVQSATTTGKFWYSSTENNVTNPDTGGAGWSNTFTMGISGNAATATTATTATNVTGSAVVTGAVQSGTNPKFRVHTSATQSITSGVFTKIEFNAVDFDVGNFFDETTNHRYQPTVAGYYRVSSAVSLTSSTSVLTYAYAIITKNAGGYAYGTLWGHGGGSPPSTAFYNSNASDIVYMNGTTDYLEVGAYIVSTGTPQVSAQAVFSGELVP